MQELTGTIHALVNAKAVRPNGVFIVVLRKEKNWKECDIYKDISLVAHAGKILLKAVARHLSDYCQRVRVLPQEQNGF